MHGKILSRKGKWNGDFAASFVKGVIDNPVYCGKLAYGRRKTEKVQGKRNEFHVVKQDELVAVGGEHIAQVKRKHGIIERENSTNVIEPSDIGNKT